MIGPKPQGATPAIDEAVEAYEAARGHDGGADLERFLPALDHPFYLDVLCELVRVDLEYGYEQNRPKRLDNYQQRFPDLFRDPQRVQEIAFEEYRLRRQAGESPFPSEYRGRYGVDCSEWPVTEVEPVELSPPPSESEMSCAAMVYQSYRREGRGDLGSRFALSGASREQAKVFEDIYLDDPPAADRLAKAIITMPEAGTRFLGFRLRVELGRGAFGRVFLAEQEEMANRHVALKITPDAGAEINALAQLQHTNIVPIYSVHREGPLQALCMPYFGSTTLANVVSGLDEGRTLPDSGRGLLSTLNERKSRLPAEGSWRVDMPSMEISHKKPYVEVVGASAVARSTAQIDRIGKSNYVDSILWMGASLADGLAHSHERGILHRDLKPANILFADDGEPMLLDFNLATDSKLRGRASTALVGGTLPYMALEQLEAFQGKPRPIDVRSDLFSLGVILFQLLSGRLPYAVRRGPLDDVLTQMIDDRRGPVPSLWTTDQPGSAAVNAVISRLLDPDPARRYESARHLKEDLLRQLENLPLKHIPEPSSRERMRKWMKRHPRLTSTTSLVAAALTVIAGLAITLSARQAQVERLEARESLTQLTAQVREAEFLLGLSDAPIQRIDEGIALCRHAVDFYGVRTDPKWMTRSTVLALDNEGLIQARQGLGELLSLWSRALTWKIEASEESRARRIAEAEQLVAIAESCYGPDGAPRVLRLQAAELARLAGHGVKADPISTEAIPLRTPRERLLLVSSCLDRGLNREAMRLAEEASRLDPLDFSVWLLRGHCLARLGQHERADQSFSIGIDLQPGFDWAYLDRGVVAMERHDYDRAIADFNRVLALSPDQPDALLNRALAKLARGDQKGAITDLDRLLKRPNAPTRALFIRSRAYQALGNLAAAEADRREGILRVPDDELSWVSRGMSRLPADPPAALADFRSARAMNPRSLWALQNEASVLSESLGQTETAVRSLDLALQYHPESLNALTGRSVLLARLGRRDEALKDTTAALSMDDSADTLYRSACTYALTSKDTPGDTGEALRLLVRAIRKDDAWLGQMDTDPDLAPLRNQPEFRRLCEALRLICPPRANQK